MAEPTPTRSRPRPTDRDRRNTQAVSERSLWQRSAACRGTGPRIFFPTGTPKLARVDEEQAKALCASCCVRLRCLAFAIEHDEGYGVWGGLNPEERRALAHNSALRPRPRGGE
jgi:WhiB family redox-sensing transcriptional regulator